MAETINMPKLGFDMAEGTLVRWIKKVGEEVKKGEVLAEIETDKATVEVESSASGVVRRLLVDEGAVVPVNSPIAIVGTADEVIEDAKTAPVKSQPVKVEGQTPKVESQPALPEEAAPVKAAYVPSAASPLSRQPEIENLQSTNLKASPLAKKIASEKNIDLARIRGTGPGGRIIRRDVESALAGQPAVALQPLAPATAQPPDNDQTIQLSKLRQAIARRMADSKTSIPHFYVTHEYKVDSLLDLRKQWNAILPEEKKASVNDFIVRAVALTLRQFPNLNASLDGNAVLRHGAINIGIAVSVEGGLLTVVCHETDKKPLGEISTEIKSMVAHVREGKVKPEEIEGSTFSISNMGMYDVENFCAIINPPEAAVLAVGTAREISVVENGTVKPGWRMKITISVDHRVSDGVEAAKFLQALAVYLEEPLRLVL